MATTTNLADFGFRELGMLRDLIDAMRAQGLPADFYNDGVAPMLNTESGYVFLTNSDYQVAMLNGGNLESYHSSPYAGREGFFADLLGEYTDMHPEDQKWFLDLAKTLGRESELPELPEADE